MEAVWQKDFVFALEVNSPIVISVPHDGVNKNDLDGFFDHRGNLPEALTTKDTRAWAIARHINKKPYFASMVRGLLPRRMVDYNRPASHQQPDHAYADNGLARYFNFYHNTIKKFCDNAVKNFGKCVLVDVHGFVSQPSFGKFEVILGTDHRKTITDNLDIKLSSNLLAEAYSVYTPTETEREGELFPGGYTILRHSAANIEAIQIEVNKKFRKESALVQRKELAGHIRDVLLTEEVRIRHERGPR